MMPKTNRSLILNLALLSLPLLALMGSCERPAAADYNNPFDPDNPGFTANPEVHTIAIDQVGALTARSGGSFSGIAGYPILVKGLCWGETLNPSLDNQCSSEGEGSGSFFTSITGLQPNTQYYVRAYATNKAGTVWGQQEAFRTTTGPGLEALDPAEITTLSVGLRGKIITDTFTPLQEYGFCIAEYNNSEGEQCIPVSHQKPISVTDLLGGYYPYGDLVQRKHDNSLETPMVEYRASGSESRENGERKSLYEDAVSKTDTHSDNKETQLQNVQELELTVTDLQPDVRYRFRVYGLSGQFVFTSATRDVVTRDGKMLIATAEPSQIEASSALSGGTISEDGGATVTARGVVWSTSQNPTITSNAGMTSNGSGTGSFTSNLTGLSPGTTYYVRAYATNSAGTAYGSQVSFTTVAALPTVTTSSASNITTNSAASGGNVTSMGGATVTARGVVWSTSQNPTITSNAGFTTDGSGTGSFTSILTGLLPGTTYYVRAYATSSAGTAYGSQVSFTTVAAQPTVTTSSASNITTNSATSGGNVTNTGGATVTARGVVWSTSQNPTITSTHGITSNGSGMGSFTSNLTALSPATTYYVRAYATSSAGTAYGSQVSFTTVAAQPTVTTSTVSSITANSAISGGNVTNTGGATVTARGVVWSTSQNPTITSNHGFTTDGSGTGSFTSILTGLSPGTTYYVRAYATNSAGTAYGSQVSFTTVAALPTVTTSTASNITANSAISGGNVTNTGGATVTARGVVWSTSQNPTITSNAGITSNGSGMGSFTSNLTGLLPGTTYYVRAYATNSAGTAYGSQVSFTTVAAPPTVTTSSASNITASSATSGGNVTNTGGATVTARGVVWSTSQNPTITSNAGITSNGSGMGSFTSNLTGLSPGTTYYVRAYATNSAGTAYGTQVSFTTTGAAVVDVTNPATGRTWMDRNLGASRAATSSTDSQSYGDLYQWGRGADGHQLRTSSTTTTLSSSNQPGHGQFIRAPNLPFDWRSPQNDNLWQGVNGINNPCPVGYRLPTEAEWNAERLSWSTNNAAGAFGSPLKLPMAGYRYLSSGSLFNVGSFGYYWSSTVSGTLASSLDFYSSNAGMYSDNRAHGSAVRCLKD